MITTLLIVLAGGLVMIAAVLAVRYRGALDALAHGQRERQASIQQERETVAALRASVEREAVVLENIDEIVYRLKPDGEHWVTDFVSPRVSEVLGYTPHEMIALGEAPIHPEDVPGVLAQVAETSRGGGTTTAQYRLRHQNGTYRWFENRLRAVPPSSPTGAVIFGVARDITEKLQSDEALRRSREDLQQALKMEALGRLAGGVAHDFNNLLTTIGGNAGLLLETMAPDDPNRAPLRDILDASERAARFTRQLLAFSRKQVLRSESLDLGEVVSSMQLLLARLVGPEYRFEVSAPPDDLPATQADRGQLEQVLMNLVVNARDAMPAGGRISVRTRASGEADEDALRRLGGQVSHYAVLEVEDNGVGIPPDLRARIFEPFFTTKEPGKGTGLGLAMVHGFVRQSGGEVDLISAPNEGTLFRIYLPALGAEATAATPVAQGVDDSTQHTVLVVDDEPGVRHLASAMLRRAGYAVLEAEGAADAESVAAAHDGRIDILLTDVVMPGARGPELATRMRDALPHLRVVYMSGFRDTAALADVERGDAVFLEKPFLGSSLIGAVKRAAPLGG